MIFMIFIFRKTVGFEINQQTKKKNKQHAKSECRYYLEKLHTYSYDFKDNCYFGDYGLKNHEVDKKTSDLGAYKRSTDTWGQ